MKINFGEFNKFNNYNGQYGIVIGYNKIDDTWRVAISSFYTYLLRNKYNS